MAKFEKEIKILDIDVENIKEKLENIGAENKGTKEQKIYVYDIPTLYYRFLEIRELLQADSTILVNTNVKKLEVLIREFKDLINDNDLNDIIKKYDLNNIEDILTKSIPEIIVFLNDNDIEKLFNQLKINPNKWIRLRQSNDKSVLTSKHILTKDTSNFQSVIETEFEVSSLEETNLFLESIGIARRSYQEKNRYSYIYKNAEIEIDIWPLIKPYMEIECEEEEIINEIIEKLELNNKEIVSLNTEQLYKRIGIDVHSISELKF